MRSLLVNGLENGHLERLLSENAAAKGLEVGRDDHKDDVLLPLFVGAEEDAKVFEADPNRQNQNGTLFGSFLN